MWERICVRRRPRPLEGPPVRGAWRGRRSTVPRLPRAGGLGTKSGPFRRPLVVLLVATGRDQLRARTASVRSVHAGHTPGAHLLHAQGQAAGVRVCAAVRALMPRPAYRPGSRSGFTRTGFGTPHAAELACEGTPMNHTTDDRCQT